MAQKTPDEYLMTVPGGHTLRLTNQQATPEPAPMKQVRTPETRRRRTQAKQQTRDKGGRFASVPFLGWLTGGRGDRKTKPARKHKRPISERSFIGRIGAFLNGDYRRHQSRQARTNSRILSSTRQERKQRR